ncbi:chitin-binding protein [Micromonospora craterilacus]|uniref:Chitin-binding protein n=1 Tax=Micromonospora craterilacus TaxID=1655439 RepID=A0A2W2EBZ4_9ACTN|nr:lytic polysaccharide monooxygenase [Micromonospora craterilacus]PZG14585.1 chitin-binding protein [Micromonospora craterilacus]
MAVRRVVVVLLVALVAAMTSAVPAAAHGAPTYPVSRAAACAPDGEHVDTPACRAAVKAGAALREWDNIRVFGVNGRDRERIPDGELCSGGLSAYRGLDLPRTDWPATPLAAGVELAVRYRTTIPHKGTFRLYLTRVGYAPTRKLTWADLETVPFLRVIDPPVRAGAYQMSGRLPGDRSGRHVIYTVWQNSDTADTYYSCSDVDIRPAGAGGRTGEEPAGVVAEATPAVAEGATPPARGDGTARGDAPARGDGIAGGDAAGGGDAVAGVERNVPVAAVTYLGGQRWPLLAGGALVALLVLLIGVRLRGTRSGPPPGRPCTVRNHRANPRVW